MRIVKYVSHQFSKPNGIGGRISTFVMNKMNQKQYSSVINALGTLNSETVLDVGFGNGYLLEKLTKKNDSKFYGIEISDDMIKLATKRNNTFIKSGKMILSKGDVVDLEFTDNFFNKIYSVNTIYFWSNLDKGLSEISRVLKPNGLFINAVYSKEFLESWSYTKYGFAKYTLKELETAAKRNGFEIVDIVNLKREQAYCFILRKQ